MESVDNEKTDENENESESESENDNESSNSQPADIRVKGGYNTGPQKGTVTGFHILR